MSRYMDRIPAPQTSMMVSEELSGKFAYNPETKIWTMEVVNNPSVYGTSTTLFPDLLMGWDISTYFLASDKHIFLTRTSRMDIIQ